MRAQLGGADPNSPCTPANSLSNCDFIRHHFYDWSTFTFSRKPTSRWLRKYRFHQRYGADLRDEPFWPTLIATIFHPVEQRFRTVNSDREQSFYTNWRKFGAGVGQFNSRERLIYPYVRRT